MNIVSSNHIDIAGEGGIQSPVEWIRAHVTQLAELFWFCLCFVLFLLMGPFSAVVVLIGLGSLASEEKREQMKEPVRL